MGDNATLFWRYNGRASTETLTENMKKMPCFDGWEFKTFKATMPLQIVASELKILEFLSGWRGDYPDDCKLFLAGTGLTVEKLQARAKKVKLGIVDNQEW